MSNQPFDAYENDMASMYILQKIVYTTYLLSLWNLTRRVFVILQECGETSMRYDLLCCPHTFIILCLIFFIFWQCTARGPILQNTPLLSRLSLTEIKHLTDTDPGQFCEVSLYALRLYFQRQGDLRAKRRLMKGYSSADLERYGLRSSSSLEKLVLTDMEDSQRQQAIAYTMKTDDGMTPNLLYKADVVLLGVSRAGKTPLSIFMAQTLGLKVANVPLVMELPPPSQLEKVNPRKVRQANNSSLEYLALKGSYEHRSNKFVCIDFLLDAAARLSRQLSSQSVPERNEEARWSTLQLRGS